MLNSAASGVLRQVDSFIALLRYIKVQIDCYALPIGDIFARCDTHLLNDCGFRESVPPENLVVFLQGCDIRDRETEEILTGFSEAFGRCYRDEQVRECDYYISLLCDRREKLANELPKRKKLNSTLCISGALAIVILLI